MIASRLVPAGTNLLAIIQTPPYPQRILMEKWAAQAVTWPFTCDVILLSQTVTWVRPYLTCLNMRFTSFASLTRDRLTYL
jgi:hypothetical protein